MSRSREHVDVLTAELTDNGVRVRGYVADVRVLVDLAVALDDDATTISEIGVLAKQAARSDKWHRTRPAGGCSTAPTSGLSQTCQLTALCDNTFAARPSSAVQPSRRRSQPNRVTCW